MLESCDIKDFDLIHAIDLWNSTPRRTRSVLDIKETFVTPSTTAITPGCSSTDTTMSLNEEPVVVLDDDIQDLSCKHDTNKNMKAVVPLSITIDLNIGSSRAVVSVANTRSNKGIEPVSTARYIRTASDGAVVPVSTASRLSTRSDGAVVFVSTARCLSTLSDGATVAVSTASYLNTRSDGATVFTARYLHTWSDRATVRVSVAIVNTDFSTWSSNDIGVDTTDLFQEHQPNITKHTLGTKDIGVNTKVSQTADWSNNQQQINNTRTTALERTAA